MYPKQESMQRPEVEAFVSFIVENYEQIAEASRIVPMNQEQAQETQGELRTLAG